MAWAGPADGTWRSPGGTVAGAPEGIRSFAGKCASKRLDADFALNYFDSSSLLRFFDLIMLMIES